MGPPPFDVSKKLDGWTLFWALMERIEGSHAETETLLRRVTETARHRLQLKDLAAQPVVASVRRLFRAAGCDPTRYRPSAEALLRRLLKGNDLPSIHPLVDINNCLSVELAVPCCVMSEGTFSPPILFRSGRSGESYESLRGYFKLENKPLLVDSQGPLDAPITGNVRVKVRKATKRAWLVVYLPSSELTADHASLTLSNLLDRAPVATVLTVGAS